jgi:sterol desaturase/sphingolipid hydroxylase (fatty acid hydroxylase superfamily)
MEDQLSELLAFAQSCIEYVVSNSNRVLLSLKMKLVRPRNAFYWFYFVTFLMWAGLAFKTTYAGKGVANFLRFVFPKEIYLHRSSGTDVQIFLMNMFFRLPRLVYPSIVATTVAAFLLGSSFADAKEYPLGPVGSLAFMLLWMMTAELGYYAAHRLFHVAPVLWEFHKVHHSAEVMTPITVNRKHPMFDLSSGVFTTILRGVVLAGLVALFGIEFNVGHLLGLNVYNGIIRFFGKHLRHSHIWWAWGPRISHVFISPAQHQIHHSCLPRHINKNYGEAFALWDWIFGSLYVPREKEDLVIGLGEEHGITNGVAAYLVPFKNVGRMARVNVRNLFRS